LVEAITACAHEAILVQSFLVRPRLYFPRGYSLPNKLFWSKQQRGYFGLEFFGRSNNGAACGGAHRALPRQKTLSKRFETYSFFDASFYLCLDLWLSLRSPGSASQATPVEDNACSKKSFFRGF